MIPPPPRSTLFPYTTLFRSLARRRQRSSLRRAPFPRDYAVAPHLIVLAALSVSVPLRTGGRAARRSEEHTSELQSHSDLVCRLLLEKKKKKTKHNRRSKQTT